MLIKLIFSIHIKENNMIEKKKKYLNRDTWTRFEGHHM